MSKITFFALLADSATSCVYYGALNRFSKQHNFFADFHCCTHVVGNYPTSDSFFLLDKRAVFIRPYFRAKTYSSSASAVEIRSFLDDLNCVNFTMEVQWAKHIHQLRCILVYSLGGQAVVVSSACTFYSSK